MTMNVRDFLTQEEIEEIKTRVVESLTSGVFMDFQPDDTANDVYGKYSLRRHITDIIRDETNKLLKGEVEKICREQIAPQITEGAKHITDRFVQQTREIADKINWYWSINR